MEGREIQNAIDRCNKQSACGYDRISYTVIGKAHYHKPSLLTDLFNALFAIAHLAAAAPSILITSKKRSVGSTRPDRPTFLANDIQGAFNNTDPARLVRIMEARLLPSYLSRWTAFSK